MKRIFNTRNMIILGVIGVGIVLYKNRKDAEYAVIEPEIISEDNSNNDEEIV